ncbi:tyrosine-protein phosphatase [Ornithinibacillus sp. BX22]|uniref:Tyrosine-protein phosphatase n=2 Tax=Ornithinibacillus TaxID=484508 RepID=A0A923L2N2_9BACI|nr:MULTISPECIES: tyrosine-protein phosphatase [Ornithinibacillus]MBC5635336.1 tyrosine-protein phosphatase [Ornithinibacillus hominis]MBS3678910.1 tyrosine-protein phosphatase [Ornithinibacillus massiliensis]
MKQVVRERKLEGSFNFRELGGYETMDGRHVKSGKLYRSGNLSAVTEAGIEVLKELEISAILDLRDEDEINKYPDPDIAGVTWNHVPLINDDKVVRQPGDLSQFENKLLNSKPGEMLVNLNRQLVSNTTGLRQVIQLLLDNRGKPILFHCMAGKDRTGVVAATILSLLGVPREIIIEDYLLTNKAQSEIEAGFEAIGHTMPDVIDKETVKAIFEARLEYIQEFFKEIEVQYGTVDSYLVNGIGLKEEEIALLRDFYLE